MAEITLQGGLSIDQAAAVLAQLLAVAACWAALHAAL